ncbi:hypothetical protein [Streptomyces sp. NBC_00046]|uniref:hypothetical protein n=1 Tax=unclassified Streptomyces TaxID=2593676 RepID=UPI00324ADEC5
MAEFEKPGDQMRRDAARLRPGPIVKISSVHSDVPSPSHQSSSSSDSLVRIRSSASTARGRRPAESAGRGSFGAYEWSLGHPRALRREQRTDNGLSVPCAWIAAMTKDDDIQQTPEGSAELWIGAVPSLGPGGRDVFLGLGSHADEPGARLARLLLDRGHEGEEGVFYLLPEDLAARYERTGDRLAVTLLARRDVLAHSLRACPEEGRILPGALPSDPLDADRVVLFRRELTTGFVPVEQGGEFQPVLLVDHTAGPDAGPEELIALFEEGEAGIAVLNAELLPDRA